MGIDIDLYSVQLCGMKCKVQSAKCKVQRTSYLVFGPENDNMTKQVKIKIFTVWFMGKMNVYIVL